MGLDLDLLGILGVASHQRSATVAAKTLVVGQLAEFLEDRQMGMIPSLRTGVVASLTALGRLGRSRLILLAIKTIGAVPRQRLFALSTIELVLELAILAAELFDFGLQFLGTIQRPGMHRLPVPGLFAQVEVIATEVGDFLPKLADLAAEVAHQLRQISPLDGWR